MYHNGDLIVDHDTQCLLDSILRDNTAEHFVISDAPGLSFEYAWRKNDLRSQDLLNRLFMAVRLLAS